MSDLDARHSEVRLNLAGGVAEIKDATHKVLELLPSDTEARALIGVALTELFTNAWEHGLLKFTDSEKESLMQEGTFEQQRAERVRLKPVHSRIQVHAMFSSQLFTCVVSDSGSGFDWRSFLESTAQAGSSSRGPGEGLSGRGLMLVRRVFDEMSWNEVGNSITVSRRINSSTS